MFLVFSLQFIPKYFLISPVFHGILQVYPYWSWIYNLMSSIKFEKFQLYFLLHIFVFLYLLHWLSGTLFMYVIPFDIISCFPESWVLLLLFSSISFFSNLQVGRISVDLFSRLPTYHSLMSLSISKYFFFNLRYIYHLKFYCILDIVKVIS